MNVRNLARRILLITISIFIIFSITAFCIDMYVGNVGIKYLKTINEINKKADTIIVLGAYVFQDGRVSDMLRDRLDYGYELYKLKKAKKIIVSGDHGKVTYDEVNNMRRYLEKKGVPREDIFMDHAGFNTYDSIYRARDIFDVKSLIVVSQKYHVVRALYIAKKLGIECEGVASDVNHYPGMGYYRIREVGARLKAFWQAGVLKPKPMLLGKGIPISGSGILTDDGK